MKVYIGGRRLCGAETESIVNKFYLERVVQKKSRRGFFNEEGSPNVEDLEVKTFSDRSLKVRVLLRDKAEYVGP